MNGSTVSRNNPAGFRFIDLFAGIGGMRRPFEEIGGRCVFTVEKDRFSRQTYRANFPDPDDGSHEFGEDIRSWSGQPSTVPAHDVLLAGFPCQPFSLAGVSTKNALGRPHGFDCDMQGMLFHDVVRILEHCRPAAFLLENVRNIISHDGGRTFARIKVSLSDAGYLIHQDVVDSSHWVPQRRRRLFIAGFREETGFDFDNLKKPSGPAPVLGDILESGEVPAKYTLGEGTWAWLRGHKKRHREQAGNGFGHSVFGPGDVARTLSARYYKDGAEILIHQDGRRPRRLTPRECARLMGFDMPGKPEFAIPVSDLQAYRQFGNAVVVPVVQAIAYLMKPHIEGCPSRYSIESNQRGRR